MPGLEREPIELRHGRSVGNIVAVFVRNEEQVWSGSDPDASKADGYSAEAIALVEENFSLIESAIPILICENENAIAIHIFPIGIRNTLHHPEPSAIIEVEGNGLHHIRLAGKERNVETFGHGHPLE